MTFAPWRPKVNDSFAWATAESWADLRGLRAWPTSPDAAGAVAGSRRAVALAGREHFCRRSCRQRDYEARRRSTDLGLSERELVVTRAELDELGDLLFVLEAAVEDVDRDLRGNPTKSDYVEAIEWLLAAARPVVERGIRSPT